MVEHAGLAALASAHERVLASRLAGISRVALNAAATFDVFFADFVNLASGRTLFVADDQSRRDPERLARFIVDNNIELFNGTPTQIRAVLLAGKADALASLRILILAGEAIDPILWRDLRGLPGVSVHNFYGPTECTVDVVSAALAEHREPVIGQALPNCHAWVVDSDLRPVRDGETGEICIAGPQVARGYIGKDPADTARFTDLAPPGSDVLMRTYRTGDRGRRNEAGQLEFLGRLDDQVKISGHRIELREVETVLRGCPGVKEAVVAAPDSGSGPALAAWVVVGSGIGGEHVREWLATMLPSYMTPKLTCVPAIPMRPSGKADIAALLRLRTQAPHGDQGAGHCQVDDSLRQIWCEVLDVSSVADADDFFALGGNSLKATNMIMATRVAVTPGVPIRVIFDHPEFGAYVRAVNNVILEGVTC
jgi:acyl-coenzyme A synthetase/AMP-(fatty) acid ligase